MISHSCTYISQKAASKQARSLIITPIALFYSSLSAPFPLPRLLLSSIQHLETNQLSLRPAAPERSAQCCIMVRQLQHILWQTTGLNNTPDLQRALVLNQRADGPQQLG